MTTKDGTETNVASIEVFHVVEGRITGSPRGRFGFGWDSAFMPNLPKSHPSHGCTYAEIEDNEKNLISHRRKALDALRANFEF